MYLKIGDVVEFKKYEDMFEDEIACIAEKYFPKYGKVTEIKSDRIFSIEDSGYLLNPKSVARVVSSAADNLNEGDEVLAKVTVIKDFNTFLQIESSVDKSDVVKVLKHEEPECFIVNEDHYDLYIGGSGDLVSDKNRAKIYASREDANEEAADMLLTAWDVIPYDD